MSKSDVTLAFSPPDELHSSDGHFYLAMYVFEEVGAYLYYKHFDISTNYPCVNEALMRGDTKPLKTMCKLEGFNIGSIRVDARKEIRNKRRWRKRIERSKANVSNR